jgi:hypothetical protein
MIRVYTNWLPIEEVTPEPALELELVLDGTRLVVERRTITRPPWDDEEDDDEDRDDNARPPDRSERELDSAEAARAAFDAEVAKLLPRVGIDPPADEDPELAWVGPAPFGSFEDTWLRVGACDRETTDEDAAPIRGDTEADDAVLADWQLGHADPHVRARGELAHLAPDHPRTKELLAAHADAWVSGMLARAELGFRRGFIDTVRLWAGRDEEDFQGWGSVSATELRSFLRLPIAARVRRLVLGSVGPVHISGNMYCDNTELVGALGESGAPALREIEIDGAYIDTLAPLGTVPALERIVVRGTFLHVGIGELASTSLRELVLDDADGAGGLDLAAVRCPRLEQLTLRPKYRGPANWLDGKLPIRRLVFAPRARVAETITLLAGSPLLAQLEELVVGGSEPGAARGALDDPRFAHLRRFVIEGVS